MSSEYATKEEVSAAVGELENLIRELTERIEKRDENIQKIIQSMNQRTEAGGHALCFAKIQAGIDVEENEDEQRLLVRGCMLMHECGRESRHKGLHQCLRCSFLWGWITKP